MNKNMSKKFRICKKLNIIFPMPLRNPGEGLRSPDSIANYGIMREVGTGEGEGMPTLLNSEEPHTVG